MNAMATPVRKRRKHADPNDSDGMSRRMLTRAAPRPPAKKRRRGGTTSAMPRNAEAHAPTRKPNCTMTVSMPAAVVDTKLDLELGNCRGGAKPRAKAAHH